MNWEAIGAIGELVGSAVVFITLIYIAIQMRESRTMAIRMARLERNQVLSRVVLETPEIAGILAKVNEIDGSSTFANEMQSTYNLSSAESELFLRYLATVWRTLETDYLTLRDEELEVTVARQMKIPSSRRFFEIQGYRFDSGFQKLVNETKSKEGDSGAT